MAISEKLRALVNRLPDPDDRDMFTENINKEEIDQTIAEIYKGGSQNVAGLIEMLGEPGSDEDVKPHYALHCLANYVLVVRDENARKELCEKLAEALAGEHSDYVRAFLCQELQWAGHREAAPALGKLLLNEALVEPATMALIAIGEGAAEQLRAALPSARGVCRLNVIQGLGAVEETQSVDALRAALRDPDREVRLAAGWGLSRLGDTGSVDALIEAADGEPGWERIQATKHCLVLAEKLAEAGKKDLAGRIYAYLRDSRTSPEEQYIREAAEKALVAA
jgi:HEAT repeat protein